MSESHVSREPSRSETKPADERSRREADDTSRSAATLANSDRDPAPNPGQRGQALPGDRGPRNQPAEGQRPSFWRRIALGGRAVSNRVTRPAAEPAKDAADATERHINGLAAKPLENASEAVATRSDQTPSAPARGVITTQKNLPSTESIENRIVEPMLQALVSVEAKLERSHVELVGRSDQVEQRLTQRLTQLWDIEEQLGTLNELQDSLLQVSEQQRLLENAVVSQTKTIRWLVGAVFLSLAAAAFVVAAVLR